MVWLIGGLGKYICQTRIPLTTPTIYYNMETATYRSLLIFVVQAVPLKVSLFAWGGDGIHDIDQNFTGGCGMSKDVDHFFVGCNFYGKI